MVDYVITFDEEDSDVIHSDRTRALKLNREGLKPGTRYSVYLAAVGDRGKISDQSESVVQQTVTLPPAHFRYTSVGTDYVTLEWDDVTGT